jgi:hypothetical protein
MHQQTYPTAVQGTVWKLATSADIATAFELPSLDNSTALHQALLF